MTGHHHLVTGIDPRPPFMCVCGAEYMEKQEKWREPKSKDGQARREAWVPEETE